MGRGTIDESEREELAVQLADIFANTGYQERARAHILNSKVLDLSRLTPFLASAIDELDERFLLLRFLPSGAASNGSVPFASFPTAYDALSDITSYAKSTQGLDALWDLGELDAGDEAEAITLVMDIRPQPAGGKKGYATEKFEFARRSRALLGKVFPKTAGSWTHIEKGAERYLLLLEDAQSTPNHHFFASPGHARGQIETCIRSTLVYKGLYDLAPAGGAALLNVKITLTGSSASTPLVIETTLR